MTGWSPRVRALRARFRRRLRAYRMAARNRAAADRCFYCDARFTPSGARQRTVDHRRARGLGGSESLGNLVFACRACNQRKADRDEAEFTASEWLARRRADVARGHAPGER